MWSTREGNLMLSEFTQFGRHWKWAFRSQWGKGNYVFKYPNRECGRGCEFMGKITKFTQTSCNWAHRAQNHTGRKRFVAVEAHQIFQSKGPTRREDTKTGQWCIVTINSYDTFWPHFRKLMLFTASVSFCMAFKDDNYNMNYEVLWHDGPLSQSHCWKLPSILRFLFSCLPKVRDRTDSHISLFTLICPWKIQFETCPWKGKTNSSRLSQLVRSMYAC